MDDDHTARIPAEIPIAPTPLSERTFPPIRDADERTMLTSLLDWYRDGVIVKASGLTDVQAAQQLVGSSSTISGLVKHLAFVEDYWFDVMFAGNPERPPFDTVDWEADPDWEFRTAREDHIADLVAMYEQACARSRTTAAAFDLDRLGVDTSRYAFTLRFVLVHMLEETARHLGHLDILREQIDGGVGW
jgi:uncharacterized damage-inducible protein DinB